MAAQRYRRVRYPNGAAQPALTAAVQSIPDPTSLQYKNPLSTAQRQGWQTEAWAFMDLVGELRYYVSWRAGSCSRVQLVASELDERGVPTGETSNEAVRDIVKAIGSNKLGASQFIKRSVECLTVPGEAFQAILADKTGREQWLAFSRDEIRKVANGSVVQMPNGDDYPLTAADSLWRVWQPHPRVARDADSPVRAVIPALREIVRTTATIADAGKSRLLGNGIVFVPSEMSLPSADAPLGLDQPGTPLELQGAPAVRQLEELLYQVARVSYEDDESFARMIPIFASVPGEMIKNVSHLKFDTELTDTALKTRNDAIARMALGLDVSPERMLGLGSSTNHWSAWAIGDNDVQLHIAPVMDLICQALTEKILRDMVIEELGPDAADDYVVWYDTSDLTADPDKTDDAQNAFDRGVITADAYREFLKLGDTGYDLTKGGMKEWQRWAADMVAKNPADLPNLLPLLDKVLQDLDFPQVALPGAGGAAPGEADTTNEGEDPETESEDPGYDQGKRGRKEDVGSRIQHDNPFVAIFVTRALELAGKRRRGYDSRTKERLRGVKPHDFHRLMEPVDPAEIPKLIAGWDDTLEDEIIEMMGVDRDKFGALVRAEVRKQLTSQVITV